MFLSWNFYVYQYPLCPCSGNACSICHGRWQMTVSCGVWWHTASTKQIGSVIWVRSKQLTLWGGQSKRSKDWLILQLKGMGYHGDFHFTSCIVSSDGAVWFKDGMTTGRQCEKDGDLETMSSRKLMKCRGRKLVLAIYTLVWLIWYCVLMCFRYKLNGRKIQKISWNVHVCKLNG